MPDRKLDSIQARVKDIELSLENMKATQLTGGRSFVNYVTNSADSYDYTHVLSAQLYEVRLTFTHTEAGKHHIVEPTVFYRIGNSNVMADPEFGDFTNDRDVLLLREAPVTGSNSWIMSLYNGQYLIDGIPRTFYIKLFFKGTTPGTFSVDPI
jgi:hypothetical protein